ncbi:AAC(3) family N-acetyltransferase [Pseudoalteromonas phenolica]|uniref:Aminoglycoside N(3)-acetyltransferase n=1 Tax=Pseudoalteromonas phenolica TaxID=161398 RepID=A0A0S2JZJ6_9GAMM|nr:AAC(3) family N-acetyltransferase [Pseudoalteromonas phenolica]ALO41433.1 hypothetical protein PP2015_915 [Pseudoalteromonas phenolica]MBE0354021.1 hypothetical protein [Pseudoalteromonas phenolica O-BC30]RXE95895.1 hypothetical protein D9981_13670 [Pseudoalteromonas phenolica O-BC30]
MQFQHNHELVKNSLDQIITTLQASFIESSSSVYWLSVDFRMLIASTGVKHTEAQKAAKYLIDSLVNKLHANETLLVSSFYFSFPQTGKFSPSSSEVQTGVFGGLLLEHFHKHRIKQPFYSFLVFGKAEPELTNKYISRSTGPNSIFEWVVKSKTELICVGHHYVKSLTSVHHAEHCANVQYRYEKTFKGTLDLKGTTPKDIEAHFYVRDLEKCDFSSLTIQGDRAFRERGLLRTHLVSTLRRPLLIHCINHYPIHLLMFEDLKLGGSCYVDYFGPTKKLHQVITGKTADELYQKELKEKSN